MRLLSVTKMAIVWERSWLLQVASMLVVLLTRTVNHDDAISLLRLQEYFFPAVCLWGVR